MPKRYKKRKDGRYLVQIEIGKKENGRPDYENIYARSQDELDKKVREFKNALDKGIIIDDTKLTVGEWADMWVKTYKANSAYYTVRRYESIIKNHIKPNIGDVRLSKLHLSAVQNLINQLAKSYSISTIRKVRDTLNQMYEMAIMSNLTHINPTSGASLPVVHNKEKDIVTELDINLLNVFEESCETGVFVLTLLYTGMRRGEIVALTWDDIDFDKMTISVNKAVEFKNNQPHIKVPKTKKSVRTIPLLNNLKPILKKHYDRRTTASEYVFVNTTNKMHSESSLVRLWNKFLAEYNEFINADIENEDDIRTVKFTMHQFRHTFATILYNAGVDIKTAQDILGHSSINITLEIYTHLEEKQKQISSNKLNEFILNQSKISQTQ